MTSSPIPWLAVAAALAAAGCAPVESVPPTATAEGPLTVQTVAAVPAAPNDRFSIVDARHVAGPGGGTIVATVQYGGGCRDHDFAAYWNGQWQAGPPPRIVVELRHDGHGDNCRALLTRELVIGLGAIPAPAGGYEAVLSGATNAVPAIRVGSS